MLIIKLLYSTLSFFKVVIGGRNKYLINGVNANNTRVQDLFCSVGLNVNNPHFLIMQVSLVSAGVCVVLVLALCSVLQGAHGCRKALKMFAF